MKKVTKKVVTAAQKRARVGKAEVKGSREELLEGCKAGVVALLEETRGKFKSPALIAAVEKLTAAIKRGEV